MRCCRNRPRAGKVSGAAGRIFWDRLWLTSREFGNSQAAIRQTDQFLQADGFGLDHTPAERCNAVSTAAFVVEVRVRQLFEFLDQSLLEHPSDGAVQRIHTGFEPAASCAANQQKMPVDPGAQKTVDPTFRVVFSDCMVNSRSPLYNALFNNPVLEESTLAIFPFALCFGSVYDPGYDQNAGFVRCWVFALHLIAALRSTGGSRDSPLHG